MKVSAMSKYFLGIDTSNYTTSAAVADENGIIVNAKCPLPVAEGARGLRQSDAVFAHIKNMPKLFDSFEAYCYTAVGYSARPRDMQGSYMPCFETGAAVASAIADSMKLKRYDFSHQAGHVRAAAFSAGCDELLRERLLAFHVSGGTTELLLVEQGKITCIGQTLDLNAGQAVDRVGVLLGLRFPCGAQLEILAGDVKAPRVKVCVTGLDCNLSGLENNARRMLDSGADKSVVAAYTLDFIAETLYKMTENALEKYGPLPVLYAGGVMSDRRIASYLGKHFDAYFAKPEFSCDNAAGIALLCRDKYYTESDNAGL